MGLPRTKLFHLGNGTTGSSRGGTFCVSEAGIYPDRSAELPRKWVGRRGTLPRLVITRKDLNVVFLTVLAAAVYCLRVRIQSSALVRAHRHSGHLVLRSPRRFLVGA